MMSFNKAIAILIIICFVSFVSIGAEKNFQKTERPNILILFLDDLDPDFGCYGNKLTTTPNIDKMASDGMIFTRAYSSATVSSPSHSSLFTGCYASTINCPHHRSTFIKKLPKGYTILTELMSNAGYFTVNFKSDGDRIYNKIYGATAKTDLNFDRGEPVNNMESGKEVFDHLHIIDPTNIGTYFKGGEWEKKNKGQPFLAYANIETGKKHGFEPGRAWAKRKGISVDSSKIQIPPHYVDNKEVRHILASSLDAVSHLDFEVGKFLKALENEGVVENTMVILLSDHGATLQRHKQCLWSTGVHIPMIIRWPSKIKPLQVNDELASIIDIAPTCLKAAGYAAPINMEGLDLLSKAPKKRKYIFATRDGMNNYFDCSRTVISKDYQYIHHFFPELPFWGNNYANTTLTFNSMLNLFTKDNLNDLQSIYFEANKTPYELYDLKKDKNQTVYLANSLSFKEKALKFQDVLFNWQKQSGDTLLFNAREILRVEKIPVGTKVDSIMKLKQLEN